MNKKSSWVLVVLFLLTIGCLSYSIILQNKKLSCANRISEQEALKIAQNVYDEAYDYLGGTLVKENSLTSISIGNEELVGGRFNTEAYKIDFSPVEKYFTKRAIHYLKTYFTDTPYGHTDGEYYVFLTNNVYSNTSKKDLLNTIFNTINDEKRDLNIVSYNDKVIVAASEKSSYIGLDEYIIFKLENEEWKIDMFENF